MRNLLILGFLFLGLNLNAQSTKQLKVYSNFTFHTEETRSYSDGPYLYTNSSQSFNLFRLSAGLAVVKENGNFIEFELSQLALDQDESLGQVRNMNNRITTDISGVKSTNFIIRTKAEYNILLNKKAGKLKYYIGAGPGLYFNHMKAIPVTSNSFPSSNAEVGLNAYLIPRMMYTINDLWSLDLNIPLPFANVNLQQMKVENPNFSAEQRKNSTLNLNFGPQFYSFRLAVARSI